MRLFDDDLVYLTPEGKRLDYLDLADAALEHYEIGPATPTFIQHNAGIVFRVEAPQMGRAYSLKLHTRIGAGTNPSTEQLEAGLQWLADLASATDVVVQVPVATAAGPFVSRILPDGLTAINCTLQYWVEGEPPNGHFTVHQVRQIAVLMAKLHGYSAQHPPPSLAPAMRHDAAALEQNVGILQTTLSEALLPAKGHAFLDAGHERIAEMIANLGTKQPVWGAIHGDLHHDNLLFYGDEVRPIDFTGLRLAHFAYDIGVTLYHIYYQGPMIRRAFLERYCDVRPLSDQYLSAVEAFVVYAAIENLAWNSSIPQQVRSEGFQRNLRQLIFSFCAAIAEGRSFVFA